MRVQPADSHADMLISPSVNQCSPSSLGIAERYNVSTNRVAGAIAVVRNDSYKGCRHWRFSRHESLDGRGGLLASERRHTRCRFPFKRQLLAFHDETFRLAVSFTPAQSIGPIGADLGG
jgi:hypothetical protein